MLHVAYTLGDQELGTNRKATTHINSSLNNFLSHNKIIFLDLTKSLPFPNFFSSESIRLELDLHKMHLHLKFR